MTTSALFWLLALALFFALALCGIFLLRSTSTVPRYLVTASLVFVVSGIFYYLSAQHLWQKYDEDSSYDNIRAALTTLKKSPKDSQAWIDIGDAYLEGNRLQDGLHAYQKAYRLGANQEPFLLRYAEILVSSDREQLNGFAGQLFEQVVKKNPRNRRALIWLAERSIAKGDLASATRYYKRLLDENPPDALKLLVAERLAEISQGPDAETAFSIPIRVKLAEAFKDQPIESQTLYIIIRDKLQPKPPLAVRKVAVEGFPVETAIDSSHQMMAGRAIVPSDNLEIVARLSLTGQPQAAVGDWFGSVALSGDDMDGSTLALSLDQVVQ